MPNTLKPCGECSLCCKLLDVPTLQKAGGVWCEHASRCGLGCAVHDTRPQICRGFDCLWRQSEVMGEELCPSKCGVMFEAYHPERTIVVIVDEHKSNAWKEGEPNKLIHQMVQDGYAVWIIVDKDKHLILPAGQDEADALERAKNAWRRKLRGSS